MVLDLVLYILVGICAIGLGVWGGIVSADALPPGRKRTIHIWGLPILGGIGCVLTICVGFRSYSAQREAAKTQSEMTSTLTIANQTIQATKAELEGVRGLLNESRMTEEHLKGQMEMIGPLVASMHSDNVSATRQLGDVISKTLADAPPFRNRYRTMPASELKAEAIDVSNKARSFSEQMHTAIDQLDSQLTRITPEQWQAETQQMISIHSQFMAQFEGQLKIPATLLRAEIIRRDPSAVDIEHKGIEFTYENPTNPLGIKEIADDLALLANRIPDDTKQHQK